MGSISIEWATYSKQGPRGLDYRVIACSDPVRTADFQQLIREQFDEAPDVRYSDALPVLAVAGHGNGAGTVSVVLASYAEQSDSDHRPLAVARYYELGAQDWLVSGLSYEWLFATLSKVESRRDRAITPAIARPVGGSFVLEVTGLAWAAAVAGALLGGLVTVIVADDVGFLVRLRAADSVAALLPAAVKKRLSMTTWAPPHSRLGTQLSFSKRALPGRLEIRYGGELDASRIPLAARRYAAAVVALAERRGLDELLLHLRTHEPNESLAVSAIDEAWDALVAFDAAFVALYQARQGEPNLELARRVLQSGQRFSLDADEVSELADSLGVPERIEDVRLLDSLWDPGHANWAAAALEQALIRGDEGLAAAALDVCVHRGLFADVVRLLPTLTPAPSSRLIHLIRGHWSAFAALPDDVLQPVAAAPAGVLERLIVASILDDAWDVAGQLARVAGFAGPRLSQLARTLVAVVTSNQRDAPEQLREINDDGALALLVAAVHNAQLSWALPLVLDWIVSDARLGQDDWSAAWRARLHSVPATISARLAGQRDATLLALGETVDLLVSRSSVAQPSDYDVALADHIASLPANARCQSAQTFGRQLARQPTFVENDRGQDLLLTLVASFAPTTGCDALGPIVTGLGHALVDDYRLVEAKVVEALWLLALAGANIAELSVRAVSAGLAARLDDAVIVRLVASGLIGGGSASELAAAVRRETRDAQATHWFVTALFGALGEPSAAPARARADWVAFVLSLVGSEEGASLYGDWLRLNAVGQIAQMATLLPALHLELGSTERELLAESARTIHETLAWSPNRRTR